jgi:SAM-dependent methyltransferase
VKDRIEILPVSLLDKERPRLMALRRLAGSLRLEFGWHYLLDLTWILSHLQPRPGMLVMDAGAGVGVIQWYLADQGIDVISVDRQSRASLPVHFRLRYRVRGLRPQDLQPLKPRQPAFSHSGRSLRRSFQGGVTFGRSWAAGRYARVFDLRQGEIVIYNQDLRTLDDIQDCSVEAVVAVSALEHNPPDQLPLVVTELLRVLKPGGAILATLAAARDEDWYHEPSKGWCYTEASLRQLFGLDEGVASNYSHYDELFEQLRNCAELRDNLAKFYFRSGDNGMPWGRWDPQYQPVGVCKVKPHV